MNQDEQHLRLLSIFHYIVGGMTAFFACFPLFHLVFGIVLVVAPDAFKSSGNGPPAFLGWLMILVAGTIILVGWTFAACIIVAGRSLASRRRYMFCLAMGGIVCLLMPYGTVLGVFTIIVLTRDSVKKVFSARQGKTS